MKQPVRGLLVAIAFVWIFALPAPAQRSVEADVMQADEAYRLAKLKQDTAALGRILDPAFSETNQNGNTRDKAQTIELWQSFSIQSLTTDSSQVQLSGDTATVTGAQTENGSDRMRFTRVYVRRASGWQLLSSRQVRDPNPPARAPAVARDGDANDVMRAEEAYRVAKLKQDTAALDRILDPAFNETNQNGNSRNKTQTIELWRGFSIRSLITDTAEVRVSGDTAMVIGTQTEDGYERMLFTRVYVNRPAGWLLLSSMQYRIPGGASF